MNKIIVALFLALSPLILIANSDKESKYDPALCKMFQDKIKSYEKKMRDDSYAKTTLESYKKRAKIYCTK
ncbi:MAG: hypothetical protein P8Y22_03295 [Sulfurimonas sp.]|jgi:hypothetical protein